MVGGVKKIYFSIPTDFEVAMKMSQACLMVGILKLLLKWLKIKRRCLIADERKEKVIAL